jgi:hypothetical protein
MPRKTRHLINTTSKLQVAPNFILDSVADSNYPGKCDVGGFLIFEWTLHIYLINFNFVGITIFNSNIENWMMSALQKKRRNNFPLFHVILHLWTIF